MILLTRIKLIIIIIYYNLLKWQAIAQWDGKLPNALSGEGAGFLIDLKK
jgi:hypothetical protein